MRQNVMINNYLITLQLVQEKVILHSSPFSTVTTVMCNSFFSIRKGSRCSNYIQVRFSLKWKVDKHISPMLMPCPQT